MADLGIARMNNDMNANGTLTRALHGLQLRKARFPIAEDVLGDPQLARQFADRQ